MPVVGTKGAMSSQGFGEFAQASTVANYIEDVFSTYLYTGNGTSQTITNGIDLAGKGGLVWSKRRNVSLSNLLFDTVRGNTKYLVSNTTGAEGTDSPATYLTSFNSNGFSVGAAAATNNLNDTYASWSFRKQPKFFDVQTFTDSPHQAQTINHNLGATPAMVILKSTDIADNWYVYHTSLGTSTYMTLNATGGSSSFANWISVSSTQVTIAASFLSSGASYVMYLYASNAGGFGLTGTDNVISCGSYTGNGSATGPIVTLGYEPQWLMIKRTNSTGDWILVDNMRGIPTGSNDQFLLANSTAAESATAICDLNATGFQITTSVSGLNTSGNTYIYMAIRRGPMKVPTSGTSVFSPTTTVNGAFPYFTSGFPVDLGFRRQNRASTGIYIVGSRLTGDNYLDTTSTAAETSGGGIVKFDSNTGWYNFTSTAPAISWMFQRAPSFFDEVCYTGTGVARTINHNLGVVPELMIVKPRSLAGENWIVYNSSLNTPEQNRLVLNGTFGQLTTPNATWWNSTNPTASVFSVGTPVGVNGSGYTYVAYLFATCAGVSKVGSYTGNGSTQTINCGFTGGARFVLIKRTDSTGDWYVYDTARGMTTLTDPYLLLNSTAAESATLGSVTTVSTGFAVNASILAAINTNAASYIFLAIA